MQELVKNMERNLCDRLKQIYKVPLNPDAFGKRQAMPREIQEAVQRGGGDAVFQRDWDLFEPTDLDILVKDADDLDRKRRA